MASYTVAPGSSVNPNDVQPVPQPYNPLAYVPNGLAGQYEAQTYLYFAVLGAWASDMFASVREEAAMIRRRRITLPIIVYYVSRLTTATYIALSVAFQVSAIGDCETLIIVTCAAFIGAISATSFLFFLRVRAMFNGNRNIVITFTLLWLGVLGSSIPAPFATHAAHLGPTNRCAVTRVDSFGSLIYPFAVLTLYDTLIFFSISWRLSRGICVRSCAGVSLLQRLRSFVYGDGLPHFSKSLLRGGQQYYLATVGLDIVVLVLYFSAGVSPIFHGILMMPTLAFQNAIACRVFRHTLLDITSIYKQRVELGSQSPIRIQHDIDLTDLLWKRGLGSEESNISLPPSAWISYEC